MDAPASDRTGTSEIIIPEVQRKATYFELF